MGIKNQIKTNLQPKKSKKKEVGSIYQAKNSRNEKLYIGKVELPKTIEDRWTEHLRKGKRLEKMRKENKDKIISGTHLNNAIAKYSLDVWNVKKIDTASNVLELNKKEKYWIKFYDSMNPNKGYSMTEGGESGKKRPELKQQISDSVGALWQDPKYRNKQQNARKEMWENPDYREKIIKSRKKTWQNPEFKENQRKRISESISDLWNTLEYREKQKKSRKKMWQNPEYQQKISNLRKKMWKNPEFREEQSKKIKSKLNTLYQDPDFAKKQWIIHSKVAKKRWENQNYRSKMSKTFSEAANKRWSNLEYKKKQTKAIVKAHKKYISNVKEFLRDIKNTSFLKELTCKYNMSDKTINARIKEILKPFKITNFTEARKFLKCNDLNVLLKKIKRNNGQNKL